MEFKTPSGKIELCNSAEERPLPDYIPTYGDDAEFHCINVRTAAAASRLC